MFHFVIISGGEILMMKLFLREPQRFFFRAEPAICLRFRDLVEELSNEGAGFKLEAVNQLFTLDQARRDDAVALANIFLQQQ